MRPIVLGRTNVQFEARISEILGLERIPEHESPGPRSVARQFFESTREGQEIVGIGRGITKAVIPGGTLAIELARGLHLLPEGTRIARIAEHSAELGVGIVQVVVGCTGIVAGTGLSGTGGGAPVGVPVLVGSLVVTTVGVANVSNSLRHLTIELWRSDDSDAAVSSSPPSESRPAETAPQTAKPTVAAPVATTPSAEPAPLKPYKEGRGQHVPAKKAFEGKSGYTPGYDPNKALAIPRDELKNLGIDHNQITGAQLRRYKEFASTGKPLTWESMAEIETAALVEARMELKTAQATVAKAIQALKDAGVAAPVRTPWGHN